MSEPVCVVGSEFEGNCSACYGARVRGTMVEGEFVTIDGNNIVVTGCRGIGDCGHETYAVGQSEVFYIEGKQVARVGDPVEGVIMGNLTTGTWVTSD